MTAQEKFWKWFVENEDRLFALDATSESGREQVFDELAERLSAVSPDLTFEFGPRESRREIIVSADGIKSAFGDVSSLVAAAPSFERWHIIAFRPRRGAFDIDIGGIKILCNDVQFSLLHNGKVAGIYLLIPGYNEAEPIYKQAGYLLLDGLLGEFDVEAKVGLIEMFSPTTDTELDRYPISELPARFDELIAKLGPVEPRA